MENLGLTVVGLSTSNSRCPNKSRVVSQSIRSNPNSINFLYSQIYPTITVTDQATKNNYAKENYS